MEEIVSRFTGVPISSIVPDKDEVIIHSFDPRDGIDKSYEVHSGLVRAFPDNMVISVPNSDSIHCLDKASTIEMLQTMISMIQSKEML